MKKDVALTSPQVIYLLLWDQPLFIHWSVSPQAVCLWLLKVRLKLRSAVKTTKTGPALCPTCPPQLEITTLSSSLMTNTSLEVLSPPRSPVRQDNHQINSEIPLSSLQSLQESACSALTSLISRWRLHEDVSAQRRHGNRRLFKNHGDWSEQPDREHQSAVWERGAVSAEEAAQQTHRSVAAAQSHFRFYWVR